MPLLRETGQLGAADEPTSQGEQRAVVQANSVLLPTETPVASKRPRGCVDGHSATQQSSQGCRLFLTSGLNHIELKFPHATLVSHSVRNTRRQRQAEPTCSSWVSSVGGRFLCAVPGPVPQQRHQDALRLPGDVLFLDTHVSCQKCLLREPGWPFYPDCWKQVGMVYSALPCSQISARNDKARPKYIPLTSFQAIFKVFEILQFYWYHLNAMKFSRKKKGHSA